MSSQTPLEHNDSANDELRLLKKPEPCSTALTREIPALYVLTLHIEILAPDVHDVRPSWVDDDSVTELGDSCQFAPKTYSSAKRTLIVVLMKGDTMTSTIRTASAAVALAAVTALGTTGCSNEDMKTSGTRSTDTSAAVTTQAVQPAGSAQSEGNEGTASEDSQSKPTTETKANTTTAVGSTDSDDSSGALPADSGSYADAFVRAYGETSDLGVQKMGTKRAISELEDYGDSAASHWDRSGIHGAAGSVEVDYTNTETHGHMKVLVNNEKASNGDGHAVTDVKFEE